jgi:hypothetical protein
MRTLKAISPSSLATWEFNREEFYLKYLAEDRPKKPPQEVYMAAGSSFDAFVKSRIHTDIFGESQTAGSPYEFETIFESQVEPQCRDKAREMGAYLMGKYISSGAYGALISDIQDSPFAPQMEFQVEKVVNGIPLLGKPDLRYITRGGVHIVSDWKVNGSYSEWGVSPVQGFKVSRSLKKNSWTTESHKKYFPKTVGDVEVNVNCLSDFSPDWATQLTMYGWCLGEEPGDENFVVRMEQFACRPGGVRSGPELQVKVVTHMSTICGRFQMNVMSRLIEMWTAIQKNHIFTDMTLEQSIENCEMVERKAAIPLGLHPSLNFSLAEKGPRFK